jgi:hypoxanthine-DNA glycosylase
MNNSRIYSFAPVIDKSVCYLILGTIPGKESLAHQQYYANKRNAFRKIISEIYHVPLDENYEKFLEAMLFNNVGLWDVVHSCERDGSLDSKIKNPKFNDIEGLIEEHNRIHTILFNGLGAYKFFEKRYRDTDLLERVKTVALPSTSPAHARMTFEEKLTAWSGGCVSLMVSR